MYKLCNKKKKKSWKKEVLLTYVKALFNHSVFELWPLTGVMDTTRWRLSTAFPPWMHVLVGCNIEKENNGCLEAPRRIFFFFFSGKKVMMQRASEQGGFVWDDYNFCFMIIIVTFLFVCGCILRSLCCAIITDGCMLGPTKRYPNLIVFWKGSDHQSPKKMLHPFVF